MPRTVWMSWLAFIDLHAQAAHRHFDDVGVAVEVHVPHLRCDERARQYLAMAAHQQLQQAELLGRQVYAPAIAGHPAAQQIQLQIGHAQCAAFAAGMAAAQDDAHPGQQLGKRERLDEIVVGPQLQALDPILHLIAGGQEQHGHFQAPVTQGLQHLPAVQARQHDIQDHQVVLAVDGHVQAIGAIGHQVRAVARLAQSLAQVGPGLGFVLDDQYLHARSLGVLVRECAEPEAAWYGDNRNVIFRTPG